MYFPFHQEIKDSFIAIPNFAKVIAAKAESVSSFFNTSKSIENECPPGVAV
jgi:hypothetical protein